MITTRRKVRSSVSMISCMETTTNRVESYPISHFSPSGKFFWSSPSSFLMSFMISRALASFSLKTARTTADFPLNVPVLL